MDLKMFFQFVVIVLIVLASALGLSFASAEPIPVWSPQRLPTVHIRPGDFDPQTLHARLQRAVFRVEAQHVPAPPYRPDPLTYDGAVVAVEDPNDPTEPTERRVLFLTSAAWLAQAQSVTLVTAEGRFPLKLARIDHTLDLAIFTALDGQPAPLEPIKLFEGDTLPDIVYALLNPQNPYEQFTPAHILGQAPGVDRYYLLTDLPVTGGYPVFDAGAQLVAVHSRHPSQTPRRGLAIAVGMVRTFFKPPGPRVVLE